MLIKDIIDEDFSNYKVPSMLICTSFCNGKCCTELELPLSVCQNDGWRNIAPVPVQDDEIIKRYLNNKLTGAIVFGGLEPFEQFDELLGIVSKLRDDYNCSDTIVIYTGFYHDEIYKKVEKLKNFKNIIIKFGRYMTGQESHFDDVLGVILANKEQYAEVIS